MRKGLIGVGMGVVLVALLLGWSGGPAQASPYSAAVLADNPKHFWELDETSGSTAKDIGSSPVNGTLQGGNAIQQNQTSLVPTDPSSSRSYNFLGGGNDYINVGNLGARPSAGSIEFWMSPSSLSQYPNVFTTGPLTGGNDNQNNAIRFEQGAPSTGTFGSAVNDGGTNANLLPTIYLSGNAGDSLVIGAKYAVVFTWDASNNVTGYLNGVQKFQMVDNHLPASFNNVTIGQGYNNTRAWKGGVDEVAMYNTTLSQAQVLAHYNAATTLANGAPTAINFDINGQGPGDPSGATYSGQAAAFQTGNFWNSTQVVSGAASTFTASHLLLSDGVTPTSVSFTVTRDPSASGPATLIADSIPGTDGVNDLLRDYVIVRGNGSDGPTKVDFTISGLQDNETYNLFLYGVAGRFGNNTQFTINGVTKVCTGNVSDFIQGASYVEFDNLTAPNGQITGYLTSADSVYALFNGFQIIGNFTPEPASLSLLAFGALALLRRRGRAGKSMGGTLAGLVAALALGLGSTAEATVYSLVDEFSTTTNPSGTWSYMFKSGVGTGTNRDGNYTLMAPNGTNNGWVGTLSGFPDIDKNLGADYHDPVNPYFTWPAGTVRFHPADPGMAIASWQAPASMTVNVAARFGDIDSGGGDGIGWYVERNNYNNTLVSGVAPNAGGSGWQFANNVSVLAGDRINFIVDRNIVNHWYDSTLVDARISTTPWVARQVVNCDINNATNRIFSGLGAVYPAGNFWNSVQVTTGTVPTITMNNLLLSDGATGSGISFTASRAGSGTPTTLSSGYVAGTDDLIGDYLFVDRTGSTASTQINFTISGLPSGAPFDLYLYGEEGQARNESQFTINGVTRTAYGSVSAAIQGESYVQFLNLTAVGGQISGTLTAGPDYNYGAFDGFQIVFDAGVPEPASLSLLALGALALLRRRRSYAPKAQDRSTSMQRAMHSRRERAEL